MKLSLASVSISCAAIMVSADLGATKEENQFDLNNNKNTHVSQSNHHNGDSASAATDSSRRLMHHKFSFDDERVESADKKNDTMEDGVSRKLENDDVILIDQDHEIVDGVVVEPFKYPFMVLANGCGASLVAHNVLLTAAHCGEAFDQSVKIGKHDIANNQEDYEEFDVEMKVPHPYYIGGENVDFDFMMVKLRGSSRFQPVQLDDENEDFAENAFVMGWGRTSENGASSNLLMSVDVNVYSEDQCYESYPNEITDRMFCAGDADKGSCQGDSGGPILNSETNKQIGIVSWGDGCARPGKPGVYAKVRNQIKWIQSLIDKWSEMSPAPTPTPACIDVYHWQENDPYNYGCDWYESDVTNCQIYGDFMGTDGYGNPMTANDACCFCGGGTGTAAPTPAPVFLQTPAPVAPTSAPTPAPVVLQTPAPVAPTPNPAPACIDSSKKFILESGKSRNCAWLTSNALDSKNAKRQRKYCGRSTVSCDKSCGYCPAPCTDDATFTFPTVYNPAISIDCAYITKSPDPQKTQKRRATYCKDSYATPNAQFKGTVNFRCPNACEKCVDA
jgi:V8-like Glu-specific endopeptidase